LRLKGAALTGMKSKVFLLAPAYNEEKSVQGLMARIQLLVDNHDLDFKFVLVNDGSKDNTLQVVRAFKCTYPVEIIDVQPNQGLANAMRTGLEYAWNNLGDDDVLVTMDADDSHNPMLIPRMLLQIHEGSDIVIASRFQRGSITKGLSRFRQITGSGAGMIFRLFVGLPNVKDYTCGFRAINGRMLRMAKEKYGANMIQEKGFSCTAEILLKLSKFNPIIHELPMILRYDRKIGASKMQVSKTISATLALIRKYRSY
jgi:dolichol-phosphate mannosyltransferase